MKTKHFIILLAMTMSLGIYACKNTETKTDTGKSSEAAVYTCPMHPEVISDKTGKCPKCGMDLVIKENGSDTTRSH